MVGGYSIAGYLIPTWISPLVLIVVSSVLLPNTSFLGHMCAVTVGYLCKCFSFNPTVYHIFRSRY